MDEQLQGLLHGDHNQEYYGARMVTMGAATVGDFLRMQVDYTLDGHVAAIACPVLLTEGEGDFAAQTQTLADHLAVPPEIVRRPRPTVRAATAKGWAPRCGRTRSSTGWTGPCLAAQPTCE